MPLPTMITQKMRQDLRALGYTDADIGKMTAIDAWCNLAGPPGSLVREAVNLALTKNWPVFPCAPGGKEPVATGGEHPDGRPKRLRWKQAATNDPVEVLRLWHKWGLDCNIGVACGFPGPTVVDQDVKTDIDGRETWAILCQQHGIDDDTNWVSLTGGGGKQQFYASPNGIIIRNSTGKLGPGIDVRAAGGYVAAPPSVHPTGSLYAWEVSSHPDDHLDSPMSDSLKTFLKQPTDAKKAAKGGLRITQTGKHPLVESILWAKTLLPRLAAERRDNYDGWLHVGMALSGLGDAGLELWDDWSKQSEKYEPGACAAKWGTWEADEDKLTLGSLAHWAEEDDPQNLDAKTEAVLPYIDAGDKELRHITELAWEALLRANEREPFIFRFGGKPTRVELDDEQGIITRLVGKDRLRHILARVANWYTLVKREDKWKRKAALPPVYVVKDVLATPDQPLPVLTALVGAPTFAPDGTLQTEPGYHAKARMFYTPAAGFVLPDVPKHPTDQEVGWAKEMISDLIGEFPFIGEPELAHATALMLLPFVRPMILGATPLHLVEKPTAGTGGSLLIDTLIHVATGQEVTAMVEGQKEAEWRKRITAKLLLGPQFIFVDNLRERLDSAALAAAITTPYWEDRILGKTEMIRLPIRCVWVMSGNNPTLSNEMARRTIRIRMDAKVERPWERTGFKHENLYQWAAQQRPKLVWAALTLAQNWIVKGRPYTGRTLGSFENWCKVVGGILEAADIPGFLGNLDDFYARADAESTAYRGLIALWWDTHQDKGVNVSDLFALASGPDVELDLGDGNERSQRIQLGILLKRQQDKHYQIEDASGKTITLKVELAGKKQRVNQWCLCLRS